MFQFPVRVSIDSGAVGGPSAGLAFTLALLDELTPGDLFGGHKVAATGTMTPSGAVGPIGGLPQKTVAVQREGATLFLVPKSEEQEAIDKAKGSNLKVVGVETLDDAIAALEGDRRQRPSRRDGHGLGLIGVAGGRLPSTLHVDDRRRPHPRSGVHGVGHLHDDAAGLRTERGARPTCSGSPPSWRRRERREAAARRELEALKSSPSRAAELDEATVAAWLGEEAARVLTTAREAASQVRAKAEEQAEHAAPRSPRRGRAGAGRGAERGGPAARRGGCRGHPAPAGVHRRVRSRDRERPARRAAAW